MTTVTDPTVPARDAPLPIKAIPQRHPWRWVSAAVLLLFAGMLVNSFLTNPAWDWSTVWKYLFSSQILKGVWLTVWVTVAAMVIGIVLGVVLAVMRLSVNPIVKSVAWIYIWFFRGTPVLVQIIFWVFLGQLYRFVSLGIPFGPQFLYFNTTELIPVIVGGLLALTLAHLVRNLQAEPIVNQPDGGTYAKGSSRPSNDPNPRLGLPRRTNARVSYAPVASTSSVSPNASSPSISSRPSHDAGEALEPPASLP